MRQRLTGKDMEIRRNDISVLYLQGKTLREIQEKTNLSARMVCYELAAIRKMWRTQQLANFNAKQQLELARLDLLEAQAWEGYELSLKPIVRTSTRKVRIKDAEGKFTDQEAIQEAVVTETRSGNPAYLDKILRCIRMRSEIVGILDPEVIPDAPTDAVTINNTTNIAVFNTISPEKLAMIKQLSQLIAEKS